MAGVLARMEHMKNVSFLIAGDGPKRTLLEEIREKRNMQNRVTLLGAMDHSKVAAYFSISETCVTIFFCIFQVREVLRQGHIFLNTSLTEAYCMAIVEAASCGLQVVSTRVGGIPEVLPSNLIHLTDATVDSLHTGLMTAIDKLQKYRKTITTNGFTKSTNSPAESSAANDVLCPYECNEILRKLYNWNDITRRTELVYQRVMLEPDPPYGDKLNCYLNTCIPFILVVSFSYLFLKFLDIIQPRKYIDIAIESKRIISHQSPQHKRKYKKKKFH